MRAIRLVVLGLGIAVCGFATGCTTGEAGGEGDHCHDDDECNDDLHCHIEDGEDEGICEAEGA